MGPHKTDNKTIGNITEAIPATDGPKWSFYDHHLTSTLCPLPFENSSQPSEGRPPPAGTINRIFKEIPIPWLKTNPIEHHGKQFQESVHEYKTRSTETKKGGKDFQGRHGQLREQVLGLYTHGLRHNL